MSKIKQHEWYCWLDSGDPDKGETIKASTSNVARNLYAKRNGCNPNNVLTRIKKLV